MTKLISGLKKGLGFINQSKSNNLDIPIKSENAPLIRNTRERHHPKEET